MSRKLKTHLLIGLAQGLTAWTSMMSYAFAQNTTENINCDDPNLTNDQKLTCLFPSEQELIEGSPQGSSTGTSLPHGDLTGDFLPFFINTALSIAGTLIFTALLFAGYLLVFVNDNEEKIEQAKKILTYCVIGTVVMATSYAVIYGIANLDLD
ncbi:MAG: hypothetical protein ACD_28C00005G0009 [uncultured bacterium]|nr:MAG: hypothetical protein ACD_28C00005G0009 [uncultured bacterium]